MVLQRCCTCRVEVCCRFDLPAEQSAVEFFFTADVVSRDLEVLDVWNRERWIPGNVEGFGWIPVAAISIDRIVGHLSDNTVPSTCDHPKGQRDFQDQHSPTVACSRKVIPGLKICLNPEKPSLIRTKTGIFKHPTDVFSKCPIRSFPAADRRCRLPAGRWNTEKPQFFLKVTHFHRLTPTRILGISRASVRQPIRGSVKSLGESSTFPEGTIRR